jgi:hypothetical protein
MRLKLGEGCGREKEQYCGEIDQVFHGEQSYS